MNYPFGHLHQKVVFKRITYVFGIPAGEETVVGATLEHREIGGSGLISRSGAAVCERNQMMILVDKIIRVKA